jgi:4-aminobutyrate aminotransferase-like enzyme
MDNKTKQRHRDNVHRRKQELRRTPEWHEKKKQSFARAYGRSRFHPMSLDPAERSWYYDGDGTKRDKQTDRVITDE